jgi:hypothetical protein
MDIRLMATDYTAEPWLALLGDPGPACGYTHDDHVQNDVPLVCVRAAGHPGGVAVPARDMHLADVDGQPVFFGDPLAVDPQTGEVIS